MGFWNDFLSLIYPRSCVCCSKLLLKDEEFICNYCFVNLPKSNFHKEPDSELDRVFEGRFPLKKAGSYLIFEKSGKVQKILHSIKYQRNQELAVKIGQWYGDLLKENESIAKSDIIIPVPLHYKKLKERGFNQSEAFANGLSQSLNIPVSVNNLVRIEYTSTQTRKSKIERWENVNGVFEVKHPVQLKNKKVLLVDDVITTGATLEACYKALEIAEIDKLGIVSLAYAKRD